MESIQPSLRGLSSFKAHQARYRLCKGSTVLLRIAIHMFRLLLFRLFWSVLWGFYHWLCLQKEFFVFPHWHGGKLGHSIVTFLCFSVQVFPLYFHIIHFEFWIGRRCTFTKQTFFFHFSLISTILLSSQTSRLVCYTEPSVLESVWKRAATLNKCLHFAFACLNFLRDQ